MSKKATAAKKPKRHYNTNFDDSIHETSTQVERTVHCIDLLAKGPQESEHLARALKTSERTLRRFMGAMHKAGVPVFTKHEPKQQKVLWVLDVEKYLERFRKNGGPGK